MPRREKPEDIARKALDTRFAQIVSNGRQLTMYAIENAIRAEMDAPTSQLSITNYYRLRRYFQDKYFTGVMDGV